MSIARRTMLTLGALLSLSACSEQGRSELANEEKIIRLWVAPNPAEERFWNMAVGRWNKLGRGARVEFTTIPATGGSEEAILTALVSGSAPDISANIFPGFAAQLANLGQLQDLSAMPGFEQIVTQRKLGDILQESKIAGNHYMMPLYFSPMLIWWRADLLNELGLKAAPQTFEEVYELSRRRARKDGGMGMQVLTGREWRSRWYDYVSYFYAGSGGVPYIKDRKAQYESPASLEALEFIRTMFKNKWTAVSVEADDPLPSGLVVGAAHGAWDITDYERKYPETLKRIIIGPMLRSQASLQANGGKAHTFADAKGLVLFKSSDMKTEALAFMAWVFGDEDLSLLWFKETGMPPARGDLMSNPRFAEFYRQHPLSARYAAYVEVGESATPIEETIDVHKILNAEMIDAMLFDDKPAREVAARAARLTNQLLERSQ